MANEKIRNLKVFKKIFEVSIRKFCRKWEGKALSKLFPTLRF